MFTRVTYYLKALKYLLTRWLDIVNQLLDKILGEKIEDWMRWKQTTSDEAKLLRERVDSAEAKMREYERKMEQWKETASEEASLLRERAEFAESRMHEYERKMEKQESKIDMLLKRFQQECELFEEFMQQTLKGKSRLLFSHS